MNNELGDNLDILKNAMSWTECKLVCTGKRRAVYHIQVTMTDGTVAKLLPNSSLPKITTALEGMLALVELNGAVGDLLKQDAVKAKLADTEDCELMGEVHRRIADDKFTDEDITNNFWSHMKPDEDQLEALVESQFDLKFELADLGELDKYKRMVASVLRGDALDYRYEFGTACPETALMLLS